MSIVIKSDRVSHGAVKTKVEAGPGYTGILPVLADTESQTRINVSDFDCWTASTGRMPVSPGPVSTFVLSKLLATGYASRRFWTGAVR